MSRADFRDVVQQFVEVRGERRRAALNDESLDALGAKAVRRRRRPEVAGDLDAPMLPGAPPLTSTRSAMFAPYPNCAPS